MKEGKLETESYFLQSGRKFRRFEWVGNSYLSLVVSTGQDKKECLCVLQYKMRRKKHVGLNFTPLYSGLNLLNQKKHLNSTKIMANKPLLIVIVLGRAHFICIMRIVNHDHTATLTKLDIITETSPYKNYPRFAPNI